MQKICIALCLSLFASLIHAGSISTLSKLNERANAQQILQHDCHTNVDIKIDKSQSTNQQTHHQCCLGVVANLSSNQCMQPDFSSHFDSHVPQLLIEVIPNHIFKPPRQIS